MNQFKKTLEQFYKHVNTPPGGINPNTDDNYLGIEVEFMSRYPAPGLRAVIGQAGLEKYIRVGSDGSIESDTYEVGDHEEWDDYTDFYAIEARILVKQSQAKRVLLKFQEILNACGAHVNSSCGLHVHIDMRHRNPIEVGNKFLAIQDTLFKMVPKHRRNNDYCLKETAPVFTEAFLKDAYASKYRAINISSYRYKKTIEIRLHHGTKNMEEVVDWCKFLVDVTNSPKDKLSSWSNKYIQERIKKYA